VAGLTGDALECIPPERLVITTDCGFGREGLSRRIAYYKCVSLVEGANIVRRELGASPKPISAPPTPDSISRRRAVPADRHQERIL
jgi:5-methyltetrahydropteroyltriglutamate--homocysteine methyltransferase